MKRFIVISVIVSLLTGCSIIQDKAEQKNKVISTPTQAIVTQKPVVETKETEKAERIVYITKTGEKYHTKYCMHIKLSRIEVTYDEAIRRNYTPCSVCNP